MRENRLICRMMVAIMMATAAAAYAADHKEGDKGTFAGTVTEKGDNWFRAKNETASERFMPQWHGGNPADGGGLDKDILAQIKALKVGDKVEVKWEYSERLRALEITVTTPAPKETPKDTPKETPKENPQ